MRFLIGDYTVLRDEICVCGRTHLRAEGGFWGRQDDMLKIRGVAVFPSAVEELLRKIGELGDEFQIIVSRESEMDVLTVVAEAQPGVSESIYPEIQAEIRAEIRAKLGVDPVVDLVPPSTLPRTEFKAKRVRDTRHL